jgi:hypothetical protein
MTNDERRQAHLLASIVAMHAYVRQGMPSEFIADAAFNMADELISKYDEDIGIVAALKKPRKK